MASGRFFTLFWIIYYPLCIAFYEEVNSYVDEFMTLLLIVYTIFRIGRTTNNAPIREACVVIGVLLFYLLYSLVVQVNVPMAAIIDFQQQVKPYAVLFCTWILAPKFSRRQRHLMLSAIVVTFAAYTIFRRDTVGESEDVVFGAMAISTAMAYYLFTKQTKRNTLIAIVIVCVGLLSGKYKYIGEATAFIVVIIFLKRKLQYNSIKIVIQAAVLAAIVIFFAWDRFNSYFIEGADNENLARPMMYKTAPKVVADYFPFGPGLGTFGTSASAKDYYSPVYYRYNLHRIWGMAPGDRGAFNADSFFPSLAQFGLVGIILFIIFWRRRLKDMDKIGDMHYYKIALMAMLCLAIESMADTSYLSNRGLPYFMLIGVCLNAKSRMPMRRMRLIPKQQQTTEGNETTTDNRGAV